MNTNCRSGQQAAGKMRGPTKIKVQYSTAGWSATPCSRIRLHDGTHDHHYVTFRSAGVHCPKDTHTNMPCVCTHTEAWARQTCWRFQLFIEPQPNSFADNETSCIQFGKTIEQLSAQCVDCCQKPQAARCCCAPRLACVDVYSRRTHKYMSTSPATSAAVAAAICKHATAGGGRQGCCVPLNTHTHTHQWCTMQVFNAACLSC